MEQAFEAVAPVLRRLAEAEHLQLHEYFRDDPVWRLSAGDAWVDVTWDESRPQEYGVCALWWEGERLHREEVGAFIRGGSPQALESLLQRALARLPGR